MSCVNFNEHMMQGVYALGYQRDRLIAERRFLTNRLRRERILSKLTATSRRLDFGLVFFAAVGTLPLIMLAGRTTPADWPVAAVCTISLLVGLAIAWQGRKMRARLIDFQHRTDASSR